jgi:transcriptional regulator of heat shock response
MLPRRKVVTLRHVEFLPLSENRVLVVLVLNAQEVQNRIIQTRRPYNAVELQQAAHYLNGPVRRSKASSRCGNPCCGICARPETVSTG